MFEHQKRVEGGLGDWTNHMRSLGNQNAWGYTGKWCLVDDVFKTLNVVFLHGLIDRSSHNGSEKIQINQVGFIPYLKDVGHCSHGLTDKSSGK